MHIALIGVNHGHQLAGCIDGQPKRFERVLGRIIPKQSFDLYAEELNEEDIERWRRTKATVSMLRLVAWPVDKKHAFCDSISSEKILPRIDNASILSIINFPRLLSDEQQAVFETKKFELDEARERLWLTKLESHAAGTCLFVLGSRHVQRFEKLLTCKCHLSVDDCKVLPLDDANPCRLCKCDRRVLLVSRKRRGAIAKQTNSNKQKQPKKQDGIKLIRATLPVGHQLTMEQLPIYPAPRIL